MHLSIPQNHIGDDQLIRCYHFQSILAQFAREDDSEAVPPPLMPLLRSGPSTVRLEKLETAPWQQFAMGTIGERLS